MSGAQTIVLGYTPDGTVLVPPNSPVTVQGGESVDVAALVASFSGVYVAQASLDTANLDDLYVLQSAISADPDDGSLVLTVGS